MIYVGKSLFLLKVSKRYFIKHNNGCKFFCVKKSLQPFVVRWTFRAETVD